MHSSLRRALTATTVTAATTGLLLLGAGTASAHVRVVPDTTSAGGYAKLTFNVPNEEAKAETSKIEVALPTATPFTSVSVRPIEGWTAKLTTTTLPRSVVVDGTTVTKAVTSVTWTADDAAHRIGADEYQSFALSVGKLPAEGTAVTLPTTQTYTNGHVVTWNQQAQGDTEPDKPAPAFTTTATADDHHGAAAATSAAGGAADAEAASVTTATSPAAGWGLGLGAAGFVLGAAALAVALLTRRHARPAAVRASAGKEAGR
ncbi:YcnI family protein [Tersicoccus sp. Bi-70]|uniref:YcnI family copper-binding membrane protein n=1 Tax=Tersicoccus sp. Bi-70 TaxID=1897634 RepID=UPI000977A83B|nr:YcnI family protein [Tersicoccus sp. Bi-70]OMH32454.1 nuclear export factor GLE1 [Tersicoccus sp. Bi-70]